MADDSGKKPRVTGTFRSALSSAEVRAFTARAPRCRVAIGVVCRPRGAPAGTAAERAIDAELVNLSTSGMLLRGQTQLEIGTVVEFQFALDDGKVPLSGSAEVVRRDAGVMGMKFVALGSGGAELVARLVEAGVTGPEVPTSPGYAEPAVEYEHGSVRVRLLPTTAIFFTYNPLLHIGVGGCFLPAEGEVPLGTGYLLQVMDRDDRLLLRCKTKVAARQERWIGLRFMDVSPDELRPLRAELAKMSSMSSLPPSADG
jgi:hypothetical protein